MNRLATLAYTISAVFVVSSAAYGDDEFVANLSGEQEVGAEVGELFFAPQPGVETDTTGVFRVAFDRGLTTARFRLRVDDGVGITQAHLHCAPAGVNGPVSVFLFGLVSPGIDVNGPLSADELTNDSFEEGVDCTATCGTTVNNIASLKAAILDGCIYANVHSEANPGGEVRGQLQPADDPRGTR